MELPIVAMWAHLLATVILVGYYAVLAVIVLPALGSLPSVDATGLISAIQHRAMPALITSLVAFLATGVYLLTSDGRYEGLGNITGAWADLLLLKHVVVVAMLVVGSYGDGVIARASAGAVTAGGTPVGVSGRITWTVRVMAVLGAIVLLLTAAAQGR